jgi:hypothetical protein
MGYTAGGGGGSWGDPDFSDADPPTPPRQGDKGPNHYVDERTFESGQPPAARSPIEDGSSSLINVTGLDGDIGPRGGTPEGLRGYRPDPVGGTYNPGQGTSGRSTKPASTSGPSERSSMA